MLHICLFFPNRSPSLSCRINTGKWQLDVLESTLRCSWTAEHVTAVVLERRHLGKVPRFRCLAASTHAQCGNPVAQFPPTQPD
ncbi:unnamed protein product [Larinioides sclopetarius]|uniref:Secreted protein n=1 Tax=Larinioides sclopetarius TaxID=280406 RepID=A0AAV1Z932_9ARAC